MAKPINTKKEQFLGFDYFKRHYLPSRQEFDFRKHKKEISEFYASYGFEVSMAYADFFSRMWYPHFSDRFMSDDVYYFYVLPALNRFDFIGAYMDKNGYDTLFPDCNKPKSVIKNINSLYFDKDNVPVSMEEAVRIVSGSKKDLIVKPSIDSGCGVGVGLIQSGSTKEKIEDDFRTRVSDFIVQERIVQSRQMSRLNESSLNTIRIMTYRSRNDGIIVINSTIRMGGASSFIDNASGGGGFCHIYEDGSIDSNVFRYKTMERISLEDFRGIQPFVIPNYGLVKSLVVNLHSRLPYFDLVGWDIAIDEDECPTFIEMNLSAESGFAQMSDGPIFGPYLEEVMSRTLPVEKEDSLYMTFTYPNGSHRFLKL